MKKTLILLLTLTLLLLSACFVGCNIFGTSKKPDDPDDTHTDRVHDLSEYGITFSCEPFEFIYNGQPCTPSVTVNYNNEVLTTVEAGKPHTDLTVEFSDNVEIGRATCVVKAKSDSRKFTGQREFNFEIKGNETRVYATDFASLKQYLGEKVYVNVAISADVEIPEGERIEIYPTTTLHLYRNDGHLTNRGEIINHGKIETGVLTNYGQIVNDEGAQLILEARGIVVNYGEIKNYGEFKSDAKRYESPEIYTDTNAKTDSYTDGYIDVYVRKPISNITLDRTSFIYTGSQIGPKLNPDHIAEINKDYTVQYENSVDVGKYSVTFTATELSKHFFGQATFEYEITHASYRATDESSLLYALKNPNYNVIYYDSKYDTVHITTLPNVTVNVSKVNFYSVTLAEGSVLNVNGALAAHTWGDIVLGENAELNVNGNMIAYANIGGSGKLNVAKGAELYFDFNAPKPTAEIYNNGGVYADFDLTGVKGDGEKIVRRNLGAEEITVDKLEYTGKNLTAKTSFEHSMEVPYNVLYYIDGKFTDTQSPRDAGDYKGQIIFNERNKYYTETAEFDFAVSPGKIKVQNHYSLLSAMDNPNYDRYEIDTLQLDSPCTIKADTTLTVNTLTNRSQITVNGTLSVGTCTNQKGKSISVGSGGTLKISGDFYNIDETSQLTFEQGANFENIGSGAAYLCKDDIPAVTGLKYVRTRDLRDTQITNVAEARYNENVTPSFDLLYDGSYVDKSVFKTLYYDYFGRTAENGAHVLITANVNDPVYYGNVTHDYTVKPGKKIIVKTGSELRTALDVGKYGLCNWEVVETANEMSLFENNEEGKVDNYIVYEGTTLIIKNKIRFSGTPDTTKYCFKNDGVIEVHEGVTLDSLMWGAGENTGIFKKYVASTDDFNRTFGINFNYYYLKADLYLPSIHLQLHARAGDFVLEMNGYKIYGLTNYTSLQIYTYGNTVTVNNGFIGTKLLVPSADNAGGQVILKHITKGVTTFSDKYYPCEIDDPNGIINNRY